MTPFLGADVGTNLIDGHDWLPTHGTPKLRCRRRHQPDRRTPADSCGISQSLPGADVGTNLIDGHKNIPGRLGHFPGGADVGTNLIDGHKNIPGRLGHFPGGADVGTNLIDGHHC